MQRVLTEQIPILVWSEDVDDATMEQARNLANLPFAFSHIALMADAHVGFGMPIGGVLAAEGQVIPHAVGLDIGCGVRAWPLNLTHGELAPVLDRILNDVQRSVPQGFEWHASSQSERTRLFDQVPDVRPLRDEIEKAARQMTTLGGGNHFVELQVDGESMCWAMVHTGSRNVGKQMAGYYDDVARRDNRQRGSSVPDEWGLAHLEIGSASGQDYMQVMGWCMRFAAENRRLIAEEVMRAVRRHFPDAAPGEAIEVHHNYASIETHFGREVVIHRKGAIHARGRVAVPGSMGTASYIAEGKASPDAFESCSHGAGRSMGRKQAMREIPRELVLAGLREKGVRLFKANKRDVSEEAPQAYKDIDSVMAHQRDLVEPLVRLTPIGVVKG